MTPHQQERRALVAAIAMCAASGAAVALRPRAVAAGPAVQLASIVPETFGKWRLDKDAVSAIISPDVQEMLTTLYADTLSRVYVDDQGTRIMLALAYGRNQNRDLQVHKPEVCYVAQGFRLVGSQKVDLETAVGAIPALRLVAEQGPRIEPITYWIRIGDRVIRGWLEQNTARVALGLRGKIPDGMLVRVSSIDRDRSEAFAQQRGFASDMLAAIAPEHLPLFVGAIHR